MNFQPNQDRVFKPFDPVYHKSQFKRFINVKSQEYHPPVLYSEYICYTHEECMMYFAWIGCNISKLFCFANKVTVFKTLSAFFYFNGMYQSPSYQLFNSIFMMEENFEVREENLNAFIAELFENIQCLTYSDVATRINERNYKISLDQLNKNFNLIQKLFIGSNLIAELNLQSFFNEAERITLQDVINQIIFQTKNPLLVKLKESQADRDRHVNINENDKRGEDWGEIFKKAEIKNREFEDSATKIKKKDDFDNILKDIYSDEEEKKQNLSDKEEKKETKKEEKLISPPKKIDLDRDIFETESKTSDYLKFETDPMDETLDFGNAQNMMDNERDSIQNLDDRAEFISEKNINKQDVEKIDKKVDDVFSMILDRKGLICLNVKSVDLVKGSVYLACDECSIPNPVKLQRRYNSDLLGKSRKNIKTKDKFILFHGKNTCRCSGVVEVFIKMVAKNLSLKYPKKIDTIFFAEILTRNSKLSEELKRQEKLNPKNTVKFFRDCEFKVTCRCNLDYNLKLSAEEDFQIQCDGCWSQLTLKLGMIKLEFFDSQELITYEKEQQKRKNIFFLMQNSLNM